MMRGHRFDLIQADQGFPLFLYKKQREIDCASVETCALGLPLQKD